ncbi:MAG: glutathione S-transferase family protein [Planctomycetota bacterium]|nr:glutathione S-transferase family protein [Planctomycetota bacterium]
MPTLHGVSVSPFARKALVGLFEKGIEFDHKIVIPNKIPEDYYAISPLGKVPCFQDGDFALPDSSAILAYLEKVKPEPALYPAEAQAYGRVVWLEEYADTKLAMTVLVPFFENVVKPSILKKEPDTARVKKVMTEDYPGVMDYVEAQLGDKTWFAGDQFTVADIAMATPFVNFQYAQQSVDAERWPKMAAFIQRAMERPSFQKALALDKAFFAAMGG